MLNPLFSSQNLRDIFPVFTDVALRSRSFITKRLDSGAREIDMHDVFSRTVLDMVGESTLGYKFDALSDSRKPQADAHGRIMWVPSA